MNPRRGGTEGSTMTFYSRANFINIEASNTVVGNYGVAKGNRSGGGSEG